MAERRIKSEQSTAGSYSPRHAAKQTKQEEKRFEQAERARRDYVGQHLN